MGILVRSRDNDLIKSNIIFETFDRGIAAGYADGLTIQDNIISRSVIGLMYVCNSFNYNIISRSVIGVG